MKAKKEELTLIETAGALRDMLTGYQRKVSKKISEDKNYAIPLDEFRRYTLLHRLSMQMILMVDELNLLDRELFEDDAFKLGEESEVDDETT